LDDAMMRATFLLPILTLFAAPAVAQTWGLPAGGLARYDADDAVEHFYGPADQKHRPLPGLGLPYATLLLESELTADRTHVERPPLDLRWIAPHLAFDLRIGKPGKVDVTMARVPRFGTLRCTGTAGVDAVTGEQVLDLKIARQPVPPNDADPKHLAGEIPKWFDGDCAGTLKLVRRFDAELGVIARFRGELRLEGKLDGTLQHEVFDFLLTQDWTLRDVLPHRAPDFEGRVAEAIRRGASWLRERLRNPQGDEFTTFWKEGEHHHGEGRLALALLTLLAAGESPKDQEIAAWLDDLRRREIRETYSLGCALLALEKAYAPPREREDLLSGLLKRPLPRVLEASDQKLVAEWTELLLANRDTSVDAAYQSRWWYTRHRDYDNSNTQYAVLGLFSAQLCRHKVNRGIWLAAAEHWLQAQHAAEGKPRPLQILGHQEARGQDLGKLRKTTGSRRAEPRGWSYRHPNDEAAYGSMTCAGVASLALCAAALDDGKLNPSEAKITAALRSGFAWLSQHKTVRCNPSLRPERHAFWYYYHLYSLERACELAHVQLLDGWDWYHDGAQVLMAVQNAGGTFQNSQFEDVCFAVLFLKKAQLPVFTGGR
jgi:hypothetical protein